MFVNVRLFGVGLHRFTNLRPFLCGCLSPLGSRVFMRVGMLHFGFPSRLHLFRRPHCRILTVVFLLLDDFFVVSDISWV